MTGQKMDLSAHFFGNTTGHEFWRVTKKGATFFFSPDDQIRVIMSEEKVQQVAIIDHCMLQRISKYSQKACVY